MSNESVNDARRSALQWSDDYGAYTPPSSLVEQIDAFLAEGHDVNDEMDEFIGQATPDIFMAAPPRTDRRGKSSVDTGGVHDISPERAPDYRKYRTTHFSRVKCSPECPYCLGARQKLGDRMGESLEESAKIPTKKTELRLTGIDSHEDPVYVDLWTPKGINNFAVFRVKELGPDLGFEAYLSDGGRWTAENYKGAKGSGKTLKAAVKAAVQSLLKKYDYDKGSFRKDMSFKVDPGITREQLRDAGLLQSPKGE